MTPKWKILPSLTTRDIVSPRTSHGGESPPSHVWRPKFTSRIAKAFSKASTRHVQDQTCALLTLPFELLEQIVELIDSKRDLCVLRRTCWQMNDYLEPRVFDDLVIDATQKGSHPTSNLLKALSSDKTPCTYLTTTLRLNNMVIFSAPVQMNWQTAMADNRLQPLQERYIVPAFKALRGLKRIYWSLKIKDPYALMAEGLGSVPGLEEVYITVDHWATASCVPLDRFSQLTVLVLEEGDYRPPLASATSVALKKALAASPNLVDLRLGVSIDGDPSLDDILSDLPILPRLSHLRALDSYFSSFNTAWTVLSNLTSIDVPNISHTTTFPLWSSFETKQIWLRSVRVDVLSTGLVRYLESYSGLETLSVRRATDWNEENGCALYLKVLEKHRESLTKFRVGLNPLSRSFSRRWALRPGFLVAIEKCEELRELAVPLSYGKGDVLVPITLHHLLCSLSRLPHLQRVQVVPIFVFPASSTGHAHFDQLTSSAMFEEVESIEVPDLDTFKFGLEIQTSYFKVMRGEDSVDGERQYRFRDLNKARE